MLEQQVPNMDKDSTLIFEAYDSNGSFGPKGPFEASHKKVLPGDTKHAETNMDNPEEKREVQIAEQIIEIAARSGATGLMPPNAWDKVLNLAHELKSIHKQ